MQGPLLVALVPWAAGRGEVGPEWRFRVRPPGEARRPLIPDIAYVCGDRLRGRSDEAIQAPASAPDVAIEIFSPCDFAADVAGNIDVYLASGSLRVIVIDPVTPTMRLHDGASPVVLRAGDTLRHAALPDFALAVGATFADVLERRF